MLKEKPASLSNLTNIPSPELLLRFHTAKALKDTVAIELIEKEFSRRDLIVVNRSILGDKHMATNSVSKDVVIKEVEKKKTSGFVEKKKTWTVKPKKKAV